VIDFVAKRVRSVQGERFVKKRRWVSDEQDDEQEDDHNDEQDHIPSAGGKKRPRRAQAP